MSVGEDEPAIEADQTVDQGPTSIEAGAKRRKMSGGRKALLALLWLVALASITVAMGWSPFLRWLTLREATRHGIELTLPESDAALDLDLTSLSGGNLTLRKMAFRLRGVGGLSGSAERVTIAFVVDGLRPTAVVGDGLQLELVGSATDLGIALAGYIKDHHELWSLPAEAKGVAIRWRPRAGEDPWVTIEGATVDPDAEGGTLTADDVAVVGFSVGKVGASWRGDDAEVTMGFGTEDLERAPVHVVVEHALKRPRATFTLKPTNIAQLAGPMAMLLPVADVTVSGRARLTFVGDGPASPIEGDVEATFEGYRPPVPPEVAGIVFGDSTSIRADVSLTGDRRRLTMKPIEVKHGAFELDGEGSMVRELGSKGADYAIVALALKGQLSCAQLATAAARIRVGGIAGSWLGHLAGRAVTGSVGVSVALRADSRRLAEASIDQQIGVGCGLRPERLLPNMPKLPGQLPALPKIEIDLTL
jgi:ADP-dependent NAD(P)H-hydrate dehydratase / NAD(P)H-hydrate epimerase